MFGKPGLIFAAEGEAEAALTDLNHAVMHGLEDGKAFAALRLILH